MPALRIILFPVFHIQLKGVFFGPAFCIIASVCSHDLFGSPQFFDGGSGMFPVFGNVLDNVKPSLDLYGMYAHICSPCIWWSYNSIILYLGV